MEALGQKFQKARTARNLTLDEAARLTKIRPNKLAEIEAEDFSQFPSLAYAKGFVQIYGKFLNVDVSPYLEAFENSEVMTVDGYSYLQDNPAPKPRRTEIVRREPSGNKSSLLPLVIGIVVLVVGFMLLKFMMDLRRIKPTAHDRDAQALSDASASAAANNANTSARVVAPRALPVDNTPAVATTNMAVPTAEPITPTATPVTAPTAIATGSSDSFAPPQSSAAPTDTTTEEPEVRRAEPVHPEDLQRALAASSTALNRFDIRPLKKTWVKVVVDDQPGGASFERALDVSGPPVQLTGKHITVKLMDPTSVEIRKNGKIISSRDADVTLQ